MLQLESITKSIREPNGQRRLLFDGLDLSMFESDRSIAILGRSGSGKSTLLRVLAGLDVAYEGRYYHGQDLVPQNSQASADFRMKHIGFVTQSYDLLDDRNVAQNVRLGIAGRGDKSALISQCLAEVQLSGFEQKRVQHLSGGEAQRVAIARALAKRPNVVLADEPTGALDETTERGILDLFADLQDRGSKFIIATHSETVAQACDYRLVLAGGKLVERD
ncbi:ABC transporter ATP-binding protein [Zhihengliuella halotolerans]|uniref:Putative ABC transport system ATP-binding protein n=1 Tax=Zhihengliuella halotolerans TaxID=370736 RepID=A0A4Q8AGR6_9MICC|nr:ABC transporter ATP-binding protein [Zhihengliuella halotolerans]RZU62923.1 putative ABC transport system ATP-binding protein [Zhihengliuella halotolerans]